MILDRKHLSCYKITEYKNLNFFQQNFPKV
jgi:hypothetical protein